MRTFGCLSVAVVAVVALLGPVAAFAAGPLSLQTLTPCRVVDTREASNSPALAHNTTRSFTIQGTCGVPVGAKAVAINVTAVSPTGQGHLRVFPSDVSLPNTSNVNFGSNDFAIANGAIVPLAASAMPDLSVYAFLLAGTGSVHLVIDISGYFVPASAAP